MPLFLERKKASRARSLIDIMHPSQRRSPSPKRRAQRPQQQDVSTDSTVSSCISYSEEGTGSFHSDRRKCVRFSTVSTHWIQCDKTTTVESVDHHEIRKSAMALERIIGALKIEEYQRMASSTRKPKVKVESKETTTQQPRRIRVATRSPPEHSNRRRILVRASSLSILPTEKRTRSPSPLRRAVSPLRRAASPLRRFRNADEKENTKTTSSIHKSNSHTECRNSKNSSNVGSRKSKKSSSSNTDSRNTKSTKHSISSSIDNNDKDTGPGFRFLRTDSFSRLGRSMRSPRKKRVDP
ncbi:hypothetical protein FisN_7Lh381 [Fistulifera solaris]|uniref:Uncharacterized protein n=1 Tax=Fistulifera solaris TaxID=1519565 RepID=A0A1Z5JBE3_FISSO|nr:hypothetical protein FisN_7Lh381 [Fistulifera solaris]|eukprot:GAX11279.1 hypothetical protein FisN_7Lh381 [Fistulifera solaris]